MKNVTIMRTQAVNKKLIFHSVLIYIATFQESFLSPRLVHNLKVSFPSRCVLFPQGETCGQISQLGKDDVCRSEALSFFISVKLTPAVRLDSGLIRGFSKDQKNVLQRCDSVPKTAYIYPA